MIRWRASARTGLLVSLGASLPALGQDTAPLQFPLEPNGLVLDAPARRGLGGFYAFATAAAPGRPHVGFQALMANALLTDAGALGSVTELLSGDFQAPLGRSSHHQIWSLAMVAAPLLRGLLGIEATDAGTRLRFAPRLPADWDRVSVGNVVAGAGRYDLALERRPGRLTLTAERRSGSGEITFGFAPALALDARVRSAEVDGRAVRPKLTRLGDVQRVEVSGRGPRSRVVLEYDEGTEVIAPITAPLPGARSYRRRDLALPLGSR
jgi:hypothetical protein